MFIPVFSTVTLLFAVTYGDLETRTKLIFIALYALSFLILLLPDWGFLFVVVHCVFIALFGGSAFGLDWLSRNR